MRYIVYHTYGHAELNGLKNKTRSNMLGALGAVYVHRLPDLTEQLGLQDSLLDSTPMHMALSAGLLILPGLLAWGVDAVARVMPVKEASRPRPFLTVAYGYMPLVWAATLAHYLDFGMTEAGQVLRVGPRSIFSTFSLFP